VLEQVFREDWGRVLASLVGWLGDIELAEDAAQEAFATAAERWPRDGVWLTRPVRFTASRSWSHAGGRRSSWTATA
jgi:RNA polymerase sigma-70 factor (ECF subfamily)